jgi:hypothetical protein
MRSGASAKRTDELDAAAQLGAVRLLAALPLIVQLSSERTLESVRQDSAFAEKQDSHPALLVVVPSERERSNRRHAPARVDARVFVADDGREPCSCCSVVR